MLTSKWTWKVWTNITHNKWYVKSSKLRVLNLSSRPELGQNSRWSQKTKVSWKKRKKIQGESWKCINFGASLSFTLFFFVSLSCALTIRSLSPNVKVLSEWVRCKIFELVRGQNNKRNQKPLKAYLCPIHCHCHARNHHAKGPSTKGYRASRKLT
jgi:hypothetical protein